MIPAIEALFLLSLFTFLGTHARTLPEDIFRISKTDYGLTSSIVFVTRPPKKSPPPPQINPPSHPVLSISYVPENKPDKIIKMPRLIEKLHKPPPPAPYVAPPRNQANACHGWTSIFATGGKTLEPSHLSQQLPYVRAKLRSFSRYPDDNENIMRPQLSSPPPPHLAPPHIQMEIYATE